MHDKQNNLLKTQTRTRRTGVGQDEDMKLILESGKNTLMKETRLFMSQSQSVRKATRLLATSIEKLNIQGKAW